MADLKSECKKRGLPVSGPKPNLLNKLAHVADEIVAEHQARLAALPQPVVTGSGKGGSKKSPPTSAHLVSGNVFNSQYSTEDVSMMPISPPVSPNNATGKWDISKNVVK